jgi:hypothetical protein
LPVSRFDPVVVEASFGLVVAKAHLGSFGLGPAMGQTVGSGRLFGFAPIGALARGSQVDNVVHEAARR